ncbi:MULTISPECIES: DUF2306 domain-containing protein [Ramlibacter]|uniref:DUF2306 domain-containing protein n=1 Tax=Ramlibacter pinisoli TaxID=2682844 RepID=A0A6N8IQZ1_9BURK|nr:MULTISPECIES: DUF2306 domain-containing protein [Ramlibacter]MBA2964301.1 DUF2306 domain-containing protein [Ramlibacter sp. CGMCC 1.13660]MVQ29267.1 DUF2306 domain-containing protein [Ramlibacter pinisoli]
MQFKSSASLVRWLLTPFVRVAPTPVQVVLLLLLAAFAAPVFLVVEAPLLLGLDQAWSARIRPYGWLLHLHAACGVLALLTGPFQLVPGVRVHYPRVHRVLGYVYLSTIAIAAPVAIWIAVFHIEPAERLASVAQALLWLFTTLAALVAIRATDVATHRLWMARSYALTLTFVIVRFTTEVLGFRFPADAGGAAAMIWLSTVCVVLAADAIVAFWRPAARPAPRGPAARRSA